MSIEGVGGQVDADGDTYMSDESSFYGDKEMRASLEARANTYDPQEYWAREHLLPASIAASALAQEKKTIPEKPYNPYAGLSCGRQLSESISEFLARLPPRTTQQATTGPWIWISNPYAPARPLNQHVGAFVAEGTWLLSELRDAIAAKETEFVGRPHSLLSRRLTALHQSATECILESALKHGVTTGKWMLFPAPADANAVWAAVARATAEGELGCEAKVATAPGVGDDGEGGSRLICVYTRNFADKEDVRKVVQGLVGLGLLAEKKTIYYKCDAFTHLDLGRGNPWGLKPSLYTSKDVLAK